MSSRPDEATVVRASSARLPTQWGEFRCHAFEDLVTGETHLALVAGEVANQPDVLVRMHSECITGDVFGSVKCDCGAQLHESFRRIAAVGRGVLVYLRGHEGRGIGIADKLRAYELQDAGRDTVDANLELGLPVDGRDYGAAVRILVELGVVSVRLLTNNPDKCAALTGFGVADAGRVPLHVPVHHEALGYLNTKQQRMGHLRRDR